MQLNKVPLKVGWAKPRDKFFRKILKIYFAYQEMYKQVSYLFANPYIYILSK